jgi:hypothetical protein
VAVNHDTSIPMLERVYSRYIGDHADALTLGALLDLGGPESDCAISASRTKDLRYVQSLPFVSKNNKNKPIPFCWILQHLFVG